MSNLLGLGVRGEMSPQSYHITLQGSSQSSSWDSWEVAFSPFPSLLLPACVCQVLGSCSEERKGEGEVHAFHPRSAEMTPLSVPLGYGESSSINVQQALKRQMEGAGQVPDANYCGLSFSLWLANQLQIFAGSKFLVKFGCQATLLKNV